MVESPPDPEIVDRSLVRFSPDRAYTGRYRQDFHDGIAADVTGDVLELGAGGGETHDRWVTGEATEVVAIDVDRYPDLDVVADGACLPFQDDAFDAVVSSAVFEHVPPSRLPTLFEEVARVLRPGGQLFAAVAFVYPLHGAPHDYSRPTIHGLADLATAADLSVETLYRGGTYVDTLCHVLFSPVRLTCSYLDVRSLAWIFAVVHYPLVAFAHLAATVLQVVYGENPFGSDWYVMNGIVATATD